MTTKQKTISLELAKKITEVAKKKGIELPESYFGWYQKYNSVWEIGDMEEVMNHAKMIEQTTAPQWEYFKAFDTAELGEMLPEKIEYDGTIQILEYVKYNNMFYIDYVYERNKKVIESVCSKTEAEARGKMYLYLIENDLLFNIKKETSDFIEKHKEAFEKLK